MSRLEEVVKNIQPLDRTAMNLASQRQKELTKPPGSLGVLETLSIKMAGIRGEQFPQVKKKVVVVMAADHGVVAEGVSAYPSEVTRQMVANFAKGGAAINVLARHVGAQVIVVDVGVAADLINIEGIRIKKVRKGTYNFSKGPAMTREEAIFCLEVGIGMAEELAEQGFDLLATGDMGIGNTTAASAILAVFTGQVLDRVVGYGTGISDGVWEHKKEVIKASLKLNTPDKDDPIDVLAKVGGLEIGAIAGLILGGAAKRLPVVIDGFISGAAALLASKLSPQVSEYMIASHVSAEPGHKLLLNEVGLKPMLYMDMRLGEGTGAVLALSLVEAACKILTEMSTFSEAGVSRSEA
jgi:nicotinate-nucleotide--dimethylbenzimidazole phosphoribosyltransferase